MGLYVCSSAPACCWWATLAAVLAAPILLGEGPSCLPICESSVAVIWQRGGCASACSRATFTVHLATPCLLCNRPSCLPVGESIGAIVWISRRWRGYHDRWLHDRWPDNHRWRNNRWRNNRWRSSGRATDVMDPAAPRLLITSPRRDSPNCAIVGIALWPWGGWHCDRRRRRSRWRRGLLDQLWRCRLCGAPPPLSLATKLLAG